MAPPSSRSQYREMYSGTRHESPPIHVWQQRQMQRAQARQERAQSAQREREEDTLHSSSSNLPDGVRARAAQLESQRQDQSVHRGREDTGNSGQQRERQAQSAQRERASSSLRERQERQERAQSALRERHQRALSAQRERQERARSAQRGQKERHTPPQRWFQERPQPVETERHEQPQMAKTERQERFQAVKLEHQKRIHSVQQPGSESNSRKRRGSSEPENEGKKSKVLDPFVGLPGDSESKSPFRRRNNDAESRQHCQNFIKKPPASAGSEPMNCVLDGAKPTVTGEAMTNDAKSRRQSHEPSYRKYGLHFIKKARSDGTGDDSASHQERHREVYTKQDLDSISGSSSGENGDLMASVEPAVGDTAREKTPNFIVRPTSSENRQPVPLNTSSSNHSQERPRGSPGLHPIHRSASAGTSHSVPGTTNIKASVGFNSSSILRSQASSTHNQGQQFINTSTPTGLDIENVELPSSADEACLHHHCNSEPSQGTQGRNSINKSRHTRQEVDELGNIEVVAACSMESGDGDVSPREQHRTAYTCKERSIHVDRSGNVEVEMPSTRRNISSRTAELIDAWSHRSTASSSNFSENARYHLRIPSSRDSAEESIKTERDRKTPTMSNIRGPRKSTGHITLSNGIFGRHSLGSEHGQRFEHGCDSRGECDGLGHIEKEFHEPFSKVCEQGMQNVGENRSFLKMKERDQKENSDQRGNEPQVPPLSQPPGPRDSHRYPTEISRRFSLGLERGKSYPCEVNGKLDEKLGNNNVLNHGPSTPGPRSKSIDQLRQRIDRNKLTNNNRLRVDPCASSDVDIEMKTCRDPSNGDEVGNASEQVQLPPTPTSSKNRKDPPSTEDSQSKGESTAPGSLGGFHSPSPIRQSLSIDSRHMSRPSVSTDSVDRYCPSQRSHGEGPESNGRQHHVLKSNNHKSAGHHPHGDPTAANHSLPESGFDLSKSRDPSNDTNEVGSSCSGRQRNETSSGDEQTSHPRMDRDPQASSYVGVGRGVKLQSNKENPSRDREVKVDDNSDVASRGSSRQMHRQGDATHHRKSFGSPGLHPHHSNRYNLTHRRSEDSSNDGNRDESEQDNLSGMPTSVRNSRPRGGESQAMRRNIVSKLKSRRSLGDEISRNENACKVSEIATEPEKRSKLEQIRRSGSRKSTGQIPDVVETASMGSQGVVSAESMDLDTPRNSSNERDTSDGNADGLFSVEILCPSNVHKTFGEITNGYTVWCSYGHERPKRYGSWAPPTKLFDTTYKRQNEANDRAKYLFYWENPLKLEPNQLRIRCDALGEKVMKNCKSYECKLKGATETWKVGVVPSEVFQWLDHAETHRHEFDEPFDAQSSIIGSSIVEALSMD